MTTCRTANDREMIDYVRSVLIKSTSSQLKRRPVTSNSNNETNSLINLLSKDVQHLNSSVEKAIIEFDSSRTDREEQFQTLSQHLIQLSVKKQTLLEAVETEINNIEHETVLDLTQVRTFHSSTLQNYAFLNSLTSPVNKLQSLHDLLVECVQSDREHRYQDLFKRLNDFTRQADQLELLLKSALIQSDVYALFRVRIESILCKMRIDHENLRDKLAYDLRQMWINGLRFQSDQVQREQHIRCVCNLKATTGNLTEYLDTLENLQLLSKLMETFCAHLQSKILNPIFDRKDRLISHDLQLSEHSVVLEMHFDMQQEDISKEHAFGYLSHVFRFLNIIFDGRSEILRRLSPLIQRLFEQLEKRVLAPLLPSKESELPSYSLLLKQAEHLQTEAVELNLLQNNQCKDFSLSVNANFGNRLCNDFLLKARSIIKQDLFPVVHVGADSLVKDCKNEQLELEQSLFAFPKCKVSSAIVQFDQLLFEIVSELSQCSNNYRFELYNTARNVIEMFVDIYPSRHKKLLQESHQPVALFHNNCFYLAHRIQMLAFNTVSLELKKTNESCLKKQEAEQEDEKEETIDFVICFADFVPVLRDLGAECLLQKVREYRKTLLEMFQDARLTQSLMDTRTQDLEHCTLRKCLQRCVYQVCSMKKHWEEILPKTVNLRIAGLLFNSLSEELISKVLAIEDISMSCCEMLSYCIDRLIQEFADQFPLVNCEIFIPKWRKLLELKFVLNANLAQLVDRWCQGAGPLALEFPAEEVKKLIRALFMNTEKRAEALYKIRSN